MDADKVLDTLLVETLAGTYFRGYKHSRTARVKILFHGD